MIAAGSLTDAYRRIDELLTARARDYPRRVEPTWSGLLAAIDGVAERLRVEWAAAAQPDEAHPLPALYEHPVFVVGHRKAGTTLLLDLLDGHPRLVALPGESNHFLQFLPRFGRLDAEARAAEAQKWWLLRLISPSGIPPFWSAGRPWELEVDPYGRFSQRLFELAVRNPERDLLGLAAVALGAALAESRGAAAGEPGSWVEKTPGHELCVDRILGVYPQARFVHLLRDPRSIAAAISRLDRATGENTDLLRLGLGVRESFAAAERNLRSLGDSRYLVLRYEELVTDPEPVMRRVAGFVGIEWADTLLTPTVGGIEATSNSAWSERRVTGQIESRRLELWRDELDDRSSELVSGLTGPAARHFGYRLPRAGRTRALAAVGARRLRSAPGAAKRLLPLGARAALRRLLAVIPYLGLRYQCPFCHLRFRKLDPRGRDLPVYAEQGVIGGGARLTQCPWCHSHDRERLLYLFLRRHTRLFRTPLRVLHFAPEARLARAIARTTQIDYKTADLRMPGVDLRIDITDMHLPDAAFDAIICSHVLEHLRDDRAAMQELRRVLDPDGWAVLQVPIASKAERTEEEDRSRPLPDDERAKRFGDPSHVRLYAEPDYVRRLEEAGFSVRADDALRLLGAKTVRDYGLVPEEKIFFCTCARASAAL